jgi:ABC-type glycerol-3-phosphate transport system substrate-binding protein
VQTGSSTPATTIQAATPTSGSLTLTATLPVTIEATPAPAEFIHIWLPPQFDPQADTPPAEILKAHLDLFITLNPGVQIDVRTKAEDGPGGLLDSLSTANVAAPLALPDLVILSRPLLEIAAIKGFLTPLDSLAPFLDDSNWYEYARQLGRLQDSAFGLPFAGEALVVVYRSAEVTQTPQTWEEVLGLESVLGFPAGDSQALFTLAQFQAADGLVQDEQGRPSLDEATLAEVLSFYQAAQNAGVFPYWLTQFDGEAQAWEAWDSGQFPLNVTWSTRYLQLPDDSGLGVGPLPTRSGQPYTLARGWVWAVASPDPNRQELALRLVKHLSDPVFLGQWTAAGGYLPPHPAALREWPAGARSQFVQGLVEAAHLAPSENLLSTLGPILRQAALAVLRQQVDPALAASQAVELLK